MRPNHSHTPNSLNRQTLRALAAAALGCGLAVSSASAQSMGSFGRRAVDPSGGGNSRQDNRQNAPASQISRPAPAAPPQQYSPVRAAPSMPSAPPQQYAPVSSAPPRQYFPTRTAPPATAGGGFGQSYGSANSQVPGYGGQRNGVSYPPNRVFNNEPPRDGVTYGTSSPTRPSAVYPPRGVNQGGNYGGASTQSQQGDFRNSGSGRGSAPGAGSASPPSGGEHTYGNVGSSGLSGSWRNEDVSGTRQPIRVTTPQGQRNWDQNWDQNRGRDHDRDRDRYIYDGGATIITNGPVLLGGYYYGNYCNYGYGQNIYPSVYTVYGGFPQYICNPAVIVLSAPYYPVYTTPYLPFYQPTYQVTYNETNYYATSEERASEIREGGETAQRAVKSAYKEGSYQAAFADIAKAWTSGNIASLRKHLRDDDTKVSILLKKKYAYSIASGDFEQITRDALDRLNTVSFKFTRLRKAKNGDVTAYGKHVYQVSGDSVTSDNTKDDGTVPFDASASDQPYDQSADPAPGEEKVVYLAYTLRHKDDLWYIIAVDSSPKPLTASDENQDDSAQ